MGTLSWEIDPTILWEDDSILVVDKPPGIPVLPDGWDRGAPFLKALLEAKFGRLWIVHRLDKFTSGVIVVARSALSHQRLNQQFAGRSVEKRYHALVLGSPKWECQEISLPLRANVGHRHRTVIDERRGKPAITRLEVLTRYRYRQKQDRTPLNFRQEKTSSETITLLAAQPLTGRTHQIRAHLAAAGYPILADDLYTPAGMDTKWVPGLGMPRLALHAVSISFHHPEDGRAVMYEAGCHQDFEKTIGLLAPM